MALLQATSIEDYFSSSPLKKRKRSPEENNNQPISTDPSSTSISSSSDLTTDIDRNTTNYKSTRRAEYDDVLVSELKPGFRGVKVTVMVVNVFEQVMRGGGGKGGGSGAGNGARGCLKVLGMDGSGVLLIHLYYADVPYDIGLGTLITVWTPHVSKVKPAEEEGGTSATAAGGGGGGGNRSDVVAGSGSAAELMTSIFPERDGKCHVRIHRMEKDKGLCRVPVGGKGLDGVVSLGGFFQGGRKGEKVLVFVKALGEVVAYTNAKGKRTEKIDVGIEDESGEAILTLFGRMMCSALKEWVPSSTILLITRPNCWGSNSSRLSVSSRTMIEADPQCLDEDVDWLRRLAGWSGRGVNERFPEEVFDVKAAEEAVTRVKFTLADIDDFARAGPKKQMFMGYLNVLLTEINLVSVYKANRFFSAECCRIPLYGNTPTSRCGQCGQNVELRLNPQIIGAITDETGTISSSPSSPHLPPSSPQKSTPNNSNNKKNRTPLLWSPEAWEQLLGQRPSEAGRWEMRELQALESSLRFLRVTLLFGWEEEKCGGRLAICRVVF